jgi:exodeoxyribonuclease VII small subunit
MTKKKLSYNEAMAEVERIVAKLRSGDITIDELTASVRRATELIGECRNHLTATEAEVERLINPEA